MTNSTLSALRYVLSFVLTFPLGVVWSLGFLILLPLSFAYRLDADKACDDVEAYWAILGRILRAIRGDNTQ